MPHIEKVAPEKVLKVGQCLEVSLMDDVNHNKFSSRIEDLNDDELILGMPMLKGYPIIPTRGSAFEAKLVTEFSAYKFVSVYKGKKMDPFPVWSASVPKFVEKFQQREFVRVKTTIPVQVRLRDEETEKLLPPVHTYIRDISGGGVRFIMDQPLPEKSIVHLEFDVPEIETIKVYAEVIRYVQPVGTEDVFWIGVKFLSLPNLIRSKLIRFIFKKQREMLKGKL